jgi:uncharacterized protein YheU (UPF0270 family)
MKIPHDELAPETLTRLLTEFVTRDGTDYGEVETTLEQKISQVRAQLRSGEIVIVFDAESETCTLIPKHELPPSER